MDLDLRASQLPLGLGGLHRGLALRGIDPGAFVLGEGGLGATGVVVWQVA